MGRQRKRSDGGQRRWNEFARRHKKHPHLNLNPLYALPEPLLDLIKNELPGFLTVEEEEFERDLARTTTVGGFFCRLPFACPLSPPPPTPEEELQRERIDALLTEAMREDKRSELQIQNYFKAEKKREDDL